MPNSLLAQPAPGIDWQKSYGGSADDVCLGIVKTADGGYITAGLTKSNNGDVTGNHGGEDVWVVKISATGTLEWQKCYGGSVDDAAVSILQTSEGGYIIAGNSRSNNGDVTGNHGDNDFWVIKISSTGTIEWQKCLGGSAWDFCTSIQLTVDGNYILAGLTESIDGDVTGLHGTISADFWIVKLSNTGNIIWQKCFGGDLDEWCRDIQLTPEGGYIAVGIAASFNGDVTGLHGPFGLPDVWVVKLSATGILEWQKCLGGSGQDDGWTVKVSPDGGYIVGAYATTGDGDVVGTAHGGFDCWTVKLSATGNIEWQSLMGGSWHDYLTTVCNTYEGGFIASCRPFSADGDVTDHIGLAGIDDYWILKFSSSGTLQWKKSFGGLMGDGPWDMLQTDDHGFIIAGGSNSIDGDVTGNHGWQDFWILKLLPDNVNIANAGPDKIICSGSSIQIGTASVVGFTYSWTSNPPGFTSSAANPVVSPATTTSYYLQVMNGSNTGYDTVVVTVNSNPSANAGTDKLICSGINTTIGIFAVGDTYSWTSSPAGFTSSIANPIVNPVATTIYYLKVTNTAGCIARDTVLVTVNPLPGANAGADRSICAGNTTGIGTFAVGNTYSWTSSPAGFTSSLPNPTVTPVVTTSYYLQVNNGAGCISRDTTVVFVSTLTTNAGADRTICTGTSSTIGLGTAASGASYSWTSNPPGFTASVFNVNVTPAITTSYYLTAILGGCIANDTVNINVLLKPKANAGKDTAICPGGTQALLNGIASDMSGTCYYSWAPLINLNFVSADSSKAVAAPTSKQQYIFSVKDNYGCNFIVSDTMTVYVQSPFNVFAGNDTIAMYDKPHQLMATRGYLYSWQPPSDLNNPFIQNPVARLKSDTYFTVTFTDTAGCKQTDDVLVKVYKGPGYYIPNAFTPNGDGLNDVFRPVPVGITNTAFFRIFNRYGEVVFETSKWMQGWDGSYKRIKAPNGEYVWILKGKDVNGASIEMKGSVLLIR